MRLVLLTLLSIAACAPDPADVAPDPSGPSAQRVADEATSEAARETSAIDFDVDDVSISSQLTGRPLQTIVTEDGSIELGVTDSVLYSRLSKETRSQIASEMEAEAEAEGQDGLGGRITRAVTRAVAEGIGTAVQVPLGDIRDVRVEGGRLVIEMAGGQRSPFEGSKSDGKPLLEQFAPADAARLAEAFDRATAGR